MSLGLGCKLCTLLPIRVHAESVLTTFVEKTAGTAVFPQTKKNTNNFPQNRLKTNKVNSLA
jgi:hypothetical protein